MSRILRSAPRSRATSCSWVLHEVHHAEEQRVAVGIGEHLARGVGEVDERRLVAVEARVREAPGAALARRLDRLGRARRVGREVVLEWNPPAVEVERAGHRVHDRLVLLLPRVGAARLLRRVEERHEVARDGGERRARRVDVLVLAVDRAAVRVDVAHLHDAGDVERRRDRDRLPRRAEEAPERVDVGVAVLVLIDEGRLHGACDAGLVADRHDEAARVAPGDEARRVRGRLRVRVVLIEEDRLGHLDVGARAIRLRRRRVDAQRRELRDERPRREQRLLRHGEQLLELRRRRARRPEHRERRLRQRAQVRIREPGPDGAERDVERPIALPRRHRRERVQRGLRRVRAARGRRVPAERVEQAPERARRRGQQRIARRQVRVRRVERRDLLQEVEERVVQRDRLPGVVRVGDARVRERAVEGLHELVAVRDHRVQLGDRELTLGLRLGARRRRQQRLIDGGAVVAVRVEVADVVERGAREIFGQRARADAIAEQAVDVVAERAFGLRHPLVVERVAGPARDRGDSEEPDADGRGGEFRQQGRRAKPAALHEAGSPRGKAATRRRTMRLAARRD